MFWGVDVRVVGYGDDHVRHPYHGHGVRPGVWYSSIHYSCFAILSHHRSVYFMIGSLGNWLYRNLFFIAHASG